MSNSHDERGEEATDPLVLAEYGDGDRPGFEPLLEHLRRDRGFDFHGYKRPTLVRRIELRMQTIGIDNFRDYLAHLESNPEEFPQLFNTILINVTAFFRDPDAWEFLSAELLPRLLASKGKDAPIRVWSAGCASGEEAFSAAMAIAELIGMEAALRRLKVYATDVDEDALSHGRQASYGSKEVGGLAPALLAKYFDASGSRYSFHKELRRCVIFGRHDLLQDAPISRVDFLLCRNTIMYFNAEAQKTILSRLHFSLNDGGLLFLGKAEMLLSHPTLFMPLDLKRRIFSAVAKGRYRDRSLAAIRVGAELSTADRSIDVRLREATFEGGPVAQLVVNAEGTLAHANERARTLFGLSARDMGRPLHDLELSYKPVELRSCIDQVHLDHRTVSLKEVEWPVRSGDSLSFDVEIAPLLEEGTILGVQISFIEVTQSKRLQKELRVANRDLEAAYEEIQSTSEELETTNEELQSTVEELETTNEELQSTNEELETMNEELESSNEELQTLNIELHDRSGQLKQANAFLGSILTSLRVGVVVLDRDLLIRVWNEKSADLWGVRTEEVLGKNFLNLDIGLPVAELRASIRACAAGEIPSGEMTVAARNRRGKPLRCKVTCTRLIDAAETVGGVIVWIEEHEG